MNPAANVRYVYIKVRHRTSKRRCFICTVHSEIFDTFMKSCNVQRSQFRKYLSKWAMEDFNWQMDFWSRSHVDLLACLVDDKYKNVYPHVYFNHIVEFPQYWLRVWVSEHMGKEIRKHDKPAYNRLFRSALYRSS